MKNLFLIFIILLLNLKLSAQGGKTNNEGIRVGKWEIIYTLNSETSYIEMTDIPDWLNSITLSPDNGRTMIKRANEDAYDSHSTTFILEKCKFKDGKKHGKFTLTYYAYDGRERIDNSIYSRGETRAVWKKTDVMSGEYLNGNLNGKICYLMNDNKMITIKYDNGKVLNQEIKYNKYFFKELNYTITPYYVFGNGYLIDALFVKYNMPIKFIKKSNGYIIQRYTKKPICYNNFSFLNEEERKKNSNISLINVNTNKFGFEVIPIIYSEKGEHLINGNYKLFNISNTFMDTTFLWASFNFKNDLREGQAQIWDESKNGKTGIAPFIKLNYLHDKLHGYSEMYYPDGQLAVSAEFKNGFVDGEVISYNYAPNHYPFEPNYLIKAWVHSGGMLSIHQIGDYKETLYNSINTIRDKGGIIENPKTYELFTKARYKVDSMQSNGIWYKGSVPADDFYQFLNGKPVTKYIVSKEKPWIPADLYYFDSKGTLVYSLSKAKGEVLAKAIEIEAEHQKYLNSEVSCGSCNKKIQIKNSKENWGGCNCIQSNGSSIEVYGTVKTFFCSIQCKMIYEKDCCIKNGYYYER